MAAGRCARQSKGMAHFHRSTGRFKAIDGIRRRDRFNTPLEEIADRLASDADDSSEVDENVVEDDRLRLIFTCCHPKKWKRCPKARCMERMLPKVSVLY